MKTLFLSISISLIFAFQATHASALGFGRAECTMSLMFRFAGRVLLKSSDPNYDYRIEAIDQATHIESSPENLFNAYALESTAAGARAELVAQCAKKFELPSGYASLISEKAANVYEMQVTSDYQEGLVYHATSGNFIHRDYLMLSGDALPKALPFHDQISQQILQFCKKASVSRYTTCSVLR